jgi:hypothetical protein
MNVLKPHLGTTVATLLAAGKSQREIERLTGVDRKTIRALVRAAGEAGSNSPGWPPAPIRKFPHPGHRLSPVAPSRHASPIAHSFTEQLALRRNYTAIYQELVDRFGFAGAYNRSSDSPAAWWPRNRRRSTTVKAP